MRILIISDLLAYGGASKLINDLMPRLVEKGHYCELLILTDEHSKYIDSLTDTGFKISVLPKSVHGHWGKIQYIKKYIDAGNFDIIHANLFPVIYYVSIIKYIDSKCPPIIMTEHSTDNKRRHKRYLRPLEQFIYRKYDGIISISKQAEEQLIKWLKDKKNKRYTIIENGIDLTRYKEAKAYEKSAVYPGCSNDDILLVMVGSFSVQKNHKNMISAMEKLPSNYKLLLVGEGPLQSEIEEIVDRKELKSRVKFLGFRTDVAELMHTCDILVIPSLWEGFGLIAAEGMASGISIVASNVEGLSDVVAECGLKFNPNQPDEIAEIVVKAYENNNRMNLIEKGKLRAENYDINRMVSEYEEIFNIALE